MLPPIQLHLDSTLGVIVIAEIMVAMLFGITSVQIYVYFHRNPRDSKFMKRTIFFLWILDGLHLAFTSHSVYHYAVTNFMNPLALTQCPWSFAIDVVFGDLSEVIVTALFAYRIWKFSGKLWPLMLIVPPAIISFAGAIAIGVFARKVPDFVEFNDKYAWVWYAVFSVQAFIDCAIAVALCTMLIKRRTGFKRTDSLIRILVVYSINTCALTSSVAIGSVITYAVMPHNFVFIAFAMVLPKLMLNALLALLNSRDKMRNMHAGQAISVHLSKLASRLARSAGSESSENPLDRRELRRSHVADQVLSKDQEIHVLGHPHDGSFDVESQASRSVIVES
ncbi:hypothetical protein PsYK624_101770 [Phanerochaete sordida]|uniref:DUF6534 domain-containing protein n=1 Tax=Phanerochaete sordida TaxID=48140 RepID=A0A9P3GI30_9APHY|nr:hypothetical protein PsYK624_101770 [Phanerochaete sordida]